MPILGCQSCAYCGCRWTYGMLELNSACHAVPLYKLPQLWLICVAILLCPLWSSVQTHGNASHASLKHMKFQILLVGFTFKRRCAVVSRYFVAYFEINGTTGHEPAQVTWTYSNIGTSQTTVQNSKQIHPISQVSTAMESNPPLLCPFCIILLWTETSLAFWSNSWLCFEQVTGERLIVSVRIENLQESSPLRELR